MIKKLKTQQLTLMDIINKTDDKEQKIALLEYLVNRLRYQLVVDHKAELEPFVEKYKEMEKETSEKKRVIGEKIIELRRKLKSVEIDNKQYQAQVSPLKREKRVLATELNRFRDNTLDKIFPEAVITVDEITQYLEEERQWELRSLRILRHLK